jgi:DNA-binding NtrC family response regulator
LLSDTGQQLATKKILLVDDERDILTVLEQMLHELPVAIDSFTDPVKAIDCLHANPTKYCLIISDIRMPEMSGVDFIKHIRQINSTVNIVVMSAFDPTLGELNSSKDQLQVSEIITKPFNFSHFLKVVRRNMTL